MDISVRKDGLNVKVPVEEASERDLRYYVENARSEAIRNACIEEQKRRAAGGKQAPSTVSAPKPPPTSEEVKSALTLVGAYTDVGQITEVFAQMRAVGHLISPAPACGVLPEGTAIAISAVMVDAEHETFPIAGEGGKLGIGKAPTFKLAGGLGAQRMRGTGRLDDCSDARFVHYCAEGRIRQLDGSFMMLSGEKIMDLREGSPQILAMKEQSENKYKKEHAAWEARNKQGQEPKPGNWENQVRDLRLRILEHAETKAWLRAIRTLGIRQAYTREELAKPFFAVKLQFTGQSSDPVIRQMFARMIGASFLGAENLLYGEQEPQASAGNATRGRRYTPRPVADTHGDPLDEEDGLPVDEGDDFPT